MTHLFSTIAVLFRVELHLHSVTSSAKSPNILLSCIVLRFVINTCSKGREVLIMTSALLLIV